MNTKERLKLNDTIDNLKYLQQKAQEGIDRFKAAFEKDPHEALTWSDQAFEDSAMGPFIDSVLKAIKFEKTTEHIKKNIQQRLLQAALNPPRSSSPSGNLAELGQTKAMARILEVL